MLNGKHILVGISGGIAAYKIPELIRLLRKEGAEVRVTTTKNALQFVTSLTLETLSNAKVYSDVFASINEHQTEHISLPDWADLMVIAPATANVLGKMAHGIADDALTTTFAATAARRPVIIVPAMNDKMYENPATQQAMSTLSQWQGVTMLDCAEGFLACGTTGKGRMQELPIIMEAIRDALTEKDMLGQHVLLTAGPTQEAIDPVRYISNYSTGKMGYALAMECKRRGAQVTIVSGPSTCEAPGCGVIHVRSAQQMAEQVLQLWPKQDIAILCAAVADFTPKQVSDEKIKKQAGQTETTICLKLTQDIAKALGESKRDGQLLVGFALETHNELANAQKKLDSKNLDLIVLNSLQDAGAGFGCDTNKVTLLYRNGDKKNLPLMDKKEVAKAIISNLFILHGND